MRTDHRSVGAMILLVLLVAMMYPALVLGLRVAPEVSLKSTAPWRAQWGPHPSPSPLAVEAATGLGPRLASIARDGTAVALWNPYIGGGRSGWLSGPAEGGAPLVLAAAFGARGGWAWTALVALELTAAFGTALWVLTLLDVPAWAASAGALAYSLSGAVASQFLGPPGSALALGPLALVPALRPTRTLAAHVLTWFGALVLLVPCGVHAVPFVALGALLEVLRPVPGRTSVHRVVAVAGALVLALMVWTPAFWLHRTGAEPGTTPPAPRPTPALSTWQAFVVPFPAGDPSSPESFSRGTADITARGEGFLGVPVLLMAAVGVAAAFRDRERFWLGIAAFATAAAFVPAAWLGGLGISERPLGALALSIAVLASFGVRHLLTKAPEGWGWGVGALICIVLLIRMVPPAAHRLPYATASDAHLSSPVSPAETAGGVRLAALLDTLPPDVSATLALRDVRAADLTEEPRYAGMLDAGPTGDLLPSRLLDPHLAELGARLILEPLPFHIVSGEIFSRIETAQAQFVSRKGGWSEYGVVVPRGATRIGLPSPAGDDARVELLGPDGRHGRLTGDDTLAGESSSWAWFAVPPRWPSGPARLSVGRAAPPIAGLSIAWDRSGLRLERESPGVRVWSWDRAGALASLASQIVEGSGAPAQPGTVTLASGALRALGGAAPVSSGRVVVTGVAPGTLHLRVSTPVRALLLARIKYRPALWSASVDGRTARTVAADQVWTAAAVGAGDHTVSFQARLPLRVKAVSAAALGLAALLALVGWRRRS